MSLFAIPYPVIDPVAFEVGPVAVRWYGLAYMFGLLFGWLYVKSLLKNGVLWPGTAPMAPQKTDDLLFWCTLGVVIGGRLGSVLFYNPGYYLENPVEVFAIWQGGMSFHGGLLGVIFVVYLFARNNRVSMLSVADICCAAAPIGIFFGRLANFVNAEVVGRVSDVPWAMVFPDAGPEPRHPSQLYEAALEGLLLFALCRYATHGKKALGAPGVVSGVFFLGYGVARIVAEQFRAFDPEHILSTGILTAGSVYSLPMVLLGAYLLWRGRRTPAPAA